jgi:hypothetical protein
MAVTDVDVHQLRGIVQVPLIVGRPKTTPLRSGDGHGVARLLNGPGKEGELPVFLDDLLGSSNGFIVCVSNQNLSSGSRFGAHKPWCEETSGKGWEALPLNASAYATK